MSQRQIKRMRKKEKKQIASSSTSWTPRNDGDILGIRQTLRENWKFLVGLCVGVILLYANSLKGDFVSDDYATITQNPMVTNFGLALKEFNFINICNSFLAAVFGVDSPFPFHVFSLFLYVNFLVWAFVLIRIIFSSNLAKLTMVLFAVHPIHVEAVSWISGKPYVLFPFLAVVCLNFFVLFAKTDKKKYLWLFLAMLPIAIQADKVRSVSLFLVLMLYGLILDRQVLSKINFKKFFLIGGAIFAVVVIILWPTILDRISSVNSGYNDSGTIFYNPFFQYPTSVAKYLQLLLIPVDLTLYHTMYVFPAWLNWLTILIYLALLIYSYFKEKSFFFALVFIFLVSAPSMSPIKVSWLVAERYMFFGSLGFCLFLALFVDLLKKKSRLVGWTLLVGLVLFYAMRTYLRNIDWQTNHNLWVNTCQVSSNSHNAWNNIGDDYDKLGDYANAIKGFGQSVVVKPNYADAYHNQANIYYKIGRLDLARQTYERALTYSPGLFQTYFSLTQIDLIEKKFDLAIQHSQKALELQPNNPQTWYVLGVVYSEAGLIDKGVEAFNKSLFIAPNYQPAIEALVKIRQGTGSS